MLVSYLQFTGNNLQLQEGLRKNLSNQSAHVYIYTAQSFDYKAIIF